MTDRDYLWCALNLLLDQQEELARLCPDCRSQVLEEPCPVCAARREDWGDNPGFDLRRFERIKGGMAGGGLSGATAGSGPGTG
ncbi:MAG TPA: molybdopterin oxidoreductase [Firmicutes bacterium]|nr:molybdopterin oxidoreductase [Bacillota bacterium]